MPTVHANGIDVYYERRGSGPRLLSFQGSGQTLARSGAMVDGFAREFDVVAFDQRGLGQTEIPPGPYEMADYAADAAALLDAIGWTSCRAVGSSFGGHGGPGARGHLPRPHRAPRAGVHVARSRFDVLDRLGTITCPTLVAAGRYDRIASPANAEKIAELIPGAELRCYDGGHVFFLQDPQAIPDVMEFLAAG